MYADTADTKHISARNFLNVQLISIQKKFWKAVSQGFSTVPLNAMYVNTVDVSHKYF